MKTPVSEDRASVLFVTNSLGRGGSEQKAVNLANGLVARGWQVAVAHLNDPVTMRAKFDPRVAVAALDRRGPFSFAALRRLVRFFDAHPSSVVVSINVYPALYAAGLRWLCGRHRVGLMASLNTSTFPTRFDRWKMSIFGPLLRRFDKLIFGAEEQRRLWCQQHGFAASRTEVLYNGIDAHKFARERVQPIVIDGWSLQRIVVGTVGILRPEKGHLLLIEAIAELRGRGHDVGLVVVGDGPERAAIEGKVRSMGLVEAVHLAGDVDDVRPYLASMSVFALPSLGETFSNATLEAMAMGVPVIVTLVGGMPEMLQHGGGRLVEPNDVGGLVVALQELVASESLRARQGAAGRAAALEHFDLQVMIEEFQELAAGVAAFRSGSA